MIWSNKKLKELRGYSKQEAQEIYRDYDRRIKEDKKQESREVDDTRELYRSKEVEKLLAYRLIVGEVLLPITPENIKFENKTEEKKHKNIFGQELILGVINLPKQVSFRGVFLYYKRSDREKLPMEYVEYFERLKNTGDEVGFKVEGSDISFLAYVTEFNYKLIPGRDIEFDMSLKEVVEVGKHEVDI